MFRKFLAFLGLTEVKVKDGKASFEMTEAQIEASGKIIDERDNALAQNETLSAERDNALANVERLTAELTVANAKIETLTTANTNLTEKVKVLGDQPAEETAEVVTETNSVEKKESDPCVVNEDADFVTNMQNVADEYL